MNKANPSFPALTSPLSASFDLGLTRRLIVLVPADADYTDAARRVWELANTSECRVLFLGLCEDAVQESGLRRQLVTMSAMLQNGNVDAEVCVEIGTNWLNVVRSTLADGDMIVCLGEQHTGLLQRPLRKILESSLRAPVYVIPSLSAGKRWRPNQLSQAAVWTGSLGIIAGFALLQIRITSLPEDWVQTTLMILTVLVEAWLIWVWNGLFG